MMDLIWEYILVFILLYSVTLGFIIRDLNWNKSKAIIFTCIYSIAIFILTIVSKSIPMSIDTAVEYIPYVYGIITCITFIFIIIYLVKYKKSIDKNFSANIKVFGREIRFFNKDRVIYNNKLVLIGMLLSSFILVVFSTIALNVNNIIFSAIEFAIISFVITILIYIVSKLLLQADRDYPAVVSEFLFLKVMLLTILTLTFETVRTLDYSMFSSYLILTPTYQMFYIIIILAIIIVIGVLLNDRSLKRLKRK